MKKPFSLENKTAIVTGGSKGIGEGLTQLVAEEGAVPVIATRSKETGERLAQELKSQGKEAIEHLEK